EREPPDGPIACGATRGAIHGEAGNARTREPLRNRIGPRRQLLTNWRIDKKHAECLVERPNEDLQGWAIAARHASRSNVPSKAGVGGCVVAACRATSGACRDRVNQGRCGRRSCPGWTCGRATTSQRSDTPQYRGNN